MGEKIPRIAPHSPCIWMQAGIAGMKQCKIDYHCKECSFNREMTRIAAENKTLREAGKIPTGRRGDVVHWKEKLLTLPHWKRPCIHHMKGQIDFRACPLEYNCGNCEFNQYFEDEYTVHTVLRPIDLYTVEGVSIPQGYYLHSGHMWAKIEEDWMVRIGMDHFSIRLFGCLDTLLSPLVGKELRQGEPDIVINRGANEARLVSPVSGIVTAVNMRLRESGEAAVRSPYTDGWIARVHAPRLRNELSNLMMGGESEEFYRGENNRLFDVIEEECGPLAADGGYPADDIYGNLPPDSWGKLVDTFLHT